jgi:hypothetical protein
MSVPKCNALDCGDKTRQIGMVNMEVTMTLNKRKYHDQLSHDDANNTINWCNPLHRRLKIPNTYLEAV